MKFKLNNVAVHTEVIQRVAVFNTSADQFDDFGQLATELAETKQALEYMLEVARRASDGSDAVDALVDEAYTEVEEYLP